MYRVVHCFEMAQRHQQPTMLIRATRHVLNIVPDQLGFPLLRTLSARVNRSPLNTQEKLAMQQAERFTLAGRPAYRWGRGPTVLLLHGWAGRAGQMAPLGVELAEAGFQAVAFDVRGHGEAPGRSTSWSTFFRDIGAVYRALNQPLHACVGHSAGALSLMALRQDGRIQAERYVTICSPSHPFPALDFIRRILAPSEGVMKAYQQDVATQFGSTWEELKSGSSYRGVGRETLLLYDLGDKIVPPSEGDKLVALYPKSNLEKLGPAGHTRVLATPELHQTIRRFLV